MSLIGVQLLTELILLYKLVLLTTQTKWLSQVARVAIGFTVLFMIINDVLTTNQTQKIDTYNSYYLSFILKYHLIRI